MLKVFHREKESIKLNGPPISCVDCIFNQLSYYPTYFLFIILYPTEYGH